MQALRKEKDQAASNQQSEGTPQLNVRIGELSLLGLILLTVSQERIKELENLLETKTKKISILEAQVEDNLDTINQCVKAHETTQKELEALKTNHQNAIERLRNSSSHELNRLSEERMTIITNFNRIDKKKIKNLLPKLKPWKRKSNP